MVIPSRSKLTSKNAYVFQVGRLLRQSDLEHIRRDIKRQLKDGVVVLNGGITFVSGDASEAVIAREAAQCSDTNVEPSEKRAFSELEWLIPLGIALLSILLHLC